MIITKNINLDMCWGKRKEKENSRNTQKPLYLGKAASLSIVSLTLEQINIT